MLQLEFGYVQFSLEDKEVLTRLVESAKENILVEVGCWTGNSTSIIAANAKKRGVKCHVVDWFKGNEGTRLTDLAKIDDVKSIFQANMIALGLNDNIVLYDEPSVTAAKKFADNSISFLFIDADHRYSGIKADLNAWYRKVKVGGIICGHDFNSHAYDEKYIETDCVNGVHHGVTKAVREFFQEDFSVDGRIWNKIKK
jgi:predicted O-methyltransferase YrrM